MHSKLFPMLARCRVRLLLQRAARSTLLPCRGARAAPWRSSHTLCSADVLLVDSQNVLSRAFADSKRGCRLPTAAGADSAAASFADWLLFLSAVAQPRLLVAVFDAPSSKRGGQQQQRQALAPEYLERRHRRAGQRRQQRQSGSDQQGSSAAPAAAGARGNPLQPFQRRVEQLGGVYLEACGGWEADDGLAAACAAVLRLHPSARVVVASGDGDMQQLLGPQVDRLQIHPMPSLSCPLALELITAGSFQQQYGFPPAAYPDWLALVGKQEASVGGAGVGGKTAAKLLSRYGSLDAVLQAAEAGELKGWGPKAARLLGHAPPSSSSSSGDAAGADSSSAGGWEQRKAQLRSRCQLFGMNGSPGVVAPGGMERLLAALDGLQPAAAAPGAAAAAAVSAASFSENGGRAECAVAPTPALAWQQPMHARRWRHLQHQLAGSKLLAQHSRPTTQQGLPVDALDELAQRSTAGGCATFYVCPCDVQAGSWPKAEEAAAAAAEAGGQQRGPAAADCTRALLPLLHGAMRHHVKLVQRAGYSVRLQLASGSREQQAVAAQKH